jgi:general secretion pathway protein G
MADKIRKVMRGEKGFTLVEMMVVLIIIAMLVVLGIWAYIGSVGSAKMTNADGDITTIQAALDAYYSTNQIYPNNQSTLASAGISSYEVNGGGPVAGIPPYGYTFLTTSGTYKVYTITSVNALYMEGIGTNGVSSPATLVPST